MTVHIPPPKRNKAAPITTTVIVKVDGCIVEILLNRRLSEKDVDVVCFLNFFAICFFLFVCWVFRCFSFAVSCY